MAPLITPEMYRLIGINAGRHAKGTTPAPMRNAYTEEAITARYHTRVVSMVAIERERVAPRTAREQHARRNGVHAMTISSHSGRSIDDVTVEAALQRRPVLGRHPDQPGDPAGAGGHRASAAARPSWR